MPLVPTAATVDEVGVLEQLRAGLEEPPDPIIGGSFAVLGLARAANVSAVRVTRDVEPGMTGTGGGSGGALPSRPANVKCTGAGVLG